MIELFHPEPTKEELLQATEDVSMSNRLARGEQVDIFENTLAESVGMDHAVALSNGTTALHAAVRAMDWGKGDKVLTSPYSFIATSNALLYEGCEPIFGQVGKNLQLDLDHTRKVLKENPDIKGILIPNIFGHRSDLEGLSKIREEFPHIGIVEDASQALATAEYGIGVGQFSDIVTYSFHENKIITTFGEGGAITTNNEELAEKILSFRQHGRLATLNWLEQIELGYNYRLSEVQAAVGTQQLKRLPDILEKRRQLARTMVNGLEETGLELPNGALRSWFGFYVIANTHEEAQSITKDLAEKEIQARPCPMPALTQFAHNKSFVSYDDEIAERAEKVVMLPLHTRMQESDLELVIDSVKSWVTKSMGSIALGSVQFYDHLSKQYETVKEERSKYLAMINNLAIQAIDPTKDESGDGLILDIGCGDGKRGLEIAKAAGCGLLAIDSSPSMVELALKNGVRAENIDIQDLDVEHEYSSVLMLWNVLGHVDGSQRIDALQKVHDALSQNGSLILDVNNMLNGAQYGRENADRNALAIASNIPNSGDFVTQRTVGEVTISTNTHIFHKQEVIDLLEKVGFEIDQITFIDYSDGSVTDENNGQIFIVARKGNIQT